MMIVEVQACDRSTYRDVLIEMQATGELCDFTIKSGHYSIQAHKCVLAACLPYFRTSFRFSEKDTNKIDMDLSHLHCDPATIEAVVLSLYRSSIEISIENVGSILQIADYLMHIDLVSAVEKFMKRTLNISTVTEYFQLCLQYGFDSRRETVNKKNHLFTSVCNMLSSRWHDYLINQSSSLDLSVDVLELMLNYSLFDYSTPLQMTTFLLKKIERLLQQSKDYDYELKKGDFSCSSIFSFMELYYTKLDKDVLSKWRHILQQFIIRWIDSLGTEVLDFNNVKKNLDKIQHSLLLVDPSVDHFIGNEDRKKQAKERIDENILSDGSSLSPATFPTCGSRPEEIHGGINDTFPSDTSIISNQVATITSPVQNYYDNYDEFCDSENSASSLCFQQTENCCKSSLQSQKNSSLVKGEEYPLCEEKRMHQTPSCHQVHGENCVSTAATLGLFCRNCLVVLSPSLEMVSQLMEVEAGRPRPFLRAPRLSLHFYDTELKLWRSVGDLDFPIPGYMLEKHSWRIAFVCKSLFFFSLAKKKGLEYNIKEGKWQELSCENLFRPHQPTESDIIDEVISFRFPVKSVIPISMGDKLVVLSMSREPCRDQSLSTQQHIYQWEPARKRFQHVTYVRDARMNRPITKWTVDGDNLVTVKASAMMFGDLQMYNVQHIHVYNARTQLLETHHVQCPMKSGLKIFLKKNKLYLLNNFGEYQIYDLDTKKQLLDWVQLSNVYPYLKTGSSGNLGQEVPYPAGVRTSCHNASSRWTLGSNFNVGSASLSELCVTEQGEFTQQFHPNPPFQYMTTMCSARIDKTYLESLDQAVYQISNFKND